MNILIEGAGSIGIALGASLISQKQDVSFFAREKTAKSIKENPIERTGIFNHITCQTNEYRVYTDYGDIPENTFDYVFICSKTTANKQISKRLNENKISSTSCKDLNGLPLFSSLNICIADLKTISSVYSAYFLLL